MRHSPSSLPASSVNLMPGSRACWRRPCFAALLTAALIALPPSPQADGPETVIIDSVAYAVPQELAAAGVQQTFATVERVDRLPSGDYAVAVHFDSNDEAGAGEEEPTCELLVLDLKGLKAVREIWAWRTTTYAGEWRDDGRYHFYGGPPSDVGRPEFRYDPNTNLVDDTY
jgi:hypothetical protein